MSLTVVAFGDCSSAIPEVVLTTHCSSFPSPRSHKRLAKAFWEMRVVHWTQPRFLQHRSLIDSNAHHRREGNRKHDQRRIWVGGGQNSQKRPFFWTERREMTSLSILPTGWFHTGHNDWHFQALFIETDRDVAEQCSIQHYLKNSIPRSGYQK